MGWGDDWPARLTLGEAAERIDFDLFDGDDEDQILVKVSVDTGNLPPMYGRSLLEQNDAEDRFTRLEQGLLGGGAEVPPVLVDADGTRDGHHRVSLAHELHLPRIAVYRPAGATLGELLGIREQHVGHYSRLGGTYWCDTCNSPYCELA